MRIEIRSPGKAVIISFDTHSDQFESAYERNKFFRGLHGWEQVVPRGERSYRYRRPGLLDQIPHMKIADSVFMVAMEHMKRVQEFFDQWEEKVEYDMLEVMMEQKKLLDNLGRSEDIRNNSRQIRIEDEEGEEQSD